MAYDNKMDLFAVNSSKSSQVSLTSTAQKSVANRGDYASRQAGGKNSDFSSHLDKASAKGETQVERRDEPVKAKDIKDIAKEVVEQDKDLPKDAVVAADVPKGNEAPAGEANVPETDDDVKVNNGSNTAALLQFMSNSHTIDALLKVMPTGQAAQFIADNMAQIQQNPTSTGDLLQLSQQLRTGAQQLSSLVQNMVDVADRNMKLPFGFKEMITDMVQPNSVEALLTPVQGQENSQTLLNMLYGRIVPQQATMQQETQPMQPMAQTMEQVMVQPMAQSMEQVMAQQSVMMNGAAEQLLQTETPLNLAQAATINVNANIQPVRTDAQQSQINTSDGDSKAANVLSNMLEGIGVAVENRPEMNPDNQQGARQQFAQQNQQLQQMTSATPEKQAQFMQVANDVAAVEIAPTDRGTQGQQDTSGVAGANLQQQTSISENVTEARPVQQPQQTAQDYEIPKQIVEQARLIRAGQDTEMVIKLNPNHLGELTLKVAVNGNGGVTATFHSDNATVRGIIETSMIQLKQELMEQGIKVDKIEISSGLQQDLQDMGQGYYAQQSRQGQQRTGTAGDLSNYEENGEGTGAVSGVASVDGIPVNNSTEPIRDSQGNIISDGVDYKV